MDGWMDNNVADARNQNYTVIVQSVK